MSQSSATGVPRALRAFAVIVVLVVIGVVVLHHRSTTPLATTTATTRPSAATTTLPSTTTSTTVVPPASIKLQVLNGTGSGNLAGRFTNQLKTAGYDTLAPDDATAKVVRSEIFVITSGYLPEAYALATAVGLPTSAVVTTFPAPQSAPIKATERAKADLVLVIGPDLVTSGTTATTSTR